MVSEPSSMEARVCKLEAQVIELGIKMDTQFQATEKSVEKLMVTMSSLENEMFSFRDEVMEALGLNKSPTLVPDEELGNLAGDSESVKIAGDSKEVKTNRGVEAPMLYAVIENPTIVDNPDIPSYQPHTHGRCDPPALIPLQMNGCSLEADCYLDTASLTFTGSWRMHCVKGSKSCDCHIAIPMGEQGSIRSVEVEETPGKYANPRRTNVEWAPMREQLKEQQPRKFAETHLMRYMADFSLFDDDQPRLWVSGLETSKLLNNGEIVEGFEGGLYNCGTQVGSLAVVDVVRMELSGTSNVSDELITKQENNVTLLEYFLIGFLVFNHLGNYGYIEGVDIKTTFDPGGMLKIIVLGLVIFLNPKDIDEIKHEALLESNKEAVKRRKIYGPNEFEMHEGLSIFRLTLDQFIDTLVRILLVAAVILFVLAWYDRDEGGEIGSLIGEYKVLADMRVVSLINSTLSLEQGSLNGGVKL